MTKRRALVTGASRGIGARIAERLAKDGHHVLVNYRTNESAAEAVLSAIQAAGGSGELLPFDVTDADAVQRSLGRALEPGPIEVLVNNAGVTRDAAFPSMSLAEWQLVTRTSLDGFFHVTQPLIMPMVLGRFGRIVTLTSAAGQLGSRGQVNYSAAKAGLIGATRSLAVEVAKKGVTVNAVAPGFIDTDMTAALDRAITKTIPAARLGTPEEVAGLVAYLVSDEAAYVTGQVFGINGGLV